MSPTCKVVFCNPCVFDIAHWNWLCSRRPCARQATIAKIATPVYKKLKRGRYLDASGIGRSTDDPVAQITFAHHWKTNGLPNRQLSCKTFLAVVLLVPRIGRFKHCVFRLDQ